jgi:hypothetical protein
MSELLPAMDFLPHVINSHYSDFGEDQSCDPFRFNMFCNLGILPVAMELCVGFIKIRDLQALLGIAI